MENELAREIPINFLTAVNRALPHLESPRVIRQLGVLAHKIERGPKKLLDAALEGHEILMKSNSVFPFQLFPDSIVIDRQKLTIANRFFYRVAKINSVPIQDILSVQADVGLFFGSVYINSRYFMTNPQAIEFLPRSEALRIQHLLQGYIIAHERGIDCKTIDKDQLITLLNDLGQGVSD